MPLRAYLSGPSHQPLLGETLGKNLARTVERHPDREALVVRHQGFRATYRELWAHTTRAAAALYAQGVQVGDRVGIWSPNRYEWTVLQFATARVGAILLNINPAYRASELQYVLAQAGVSRLFLAEGFRETSYTELLAGVRPACPALVDAVVLDTGWEAFLAGGAGVTDEQLAAREASLQFDDPINIQYTSGTTGLPKGATLTHHNILNNGYFIGEILNYTEADRVCIPVPLYHCFGMVIGNLACVTHGACMVLPSAGFEPAAVIACVQEERCTSHYGVPTMFIAVLEHPDVAHADFSTLRTGVMAGSPCPIEVMKKVQTQLHMPEVCICYGMTETSPVSLQSAPDEPLEKRVTTVGRVHPHLELKVVDPETGALLPRNQPGELLTRGYSVMRGYWNDEPATRLAIDAARWMHTGDLAVVDDDGYVKIVGRIKDMIVRGGENIYPREIEEFLYTHPAIADVQVIGVPSTKYGEEVMAWLIPHEHATLDPADLPAFCKGRIASYKIPRYWKVTDAFPMTISGKVQKFKMREAAIAELGLHEAAAVETA